MKTRKEIIWVAGLFSVLLAGCNSLDLAGALFLQGDGKGDRMVAASVDSVATSVQATLGRLGLAATVTKQGEAVQISSKTANGAKFTIVLNREQGKAGEQTRVHVQWDGTRDDQIAFQLLSEVEIVGKH